MRLVLDTNVLISALFWEGNERKVLWECRKKKHQLIISPGILEEMDRILDKKFKVPSDKRAEYSRDLVWMAEIVFPRGDIHIVEEHAADNMIVETAVLGKADR